MANRCERCPLCGSCRFCGRPLDDVTPVAGCARDGGCPNDENALARELYAGRSAGDAACATCCDPRYGCREYNQRDRCRFWPGFSHPRWLYCDELYSRRGNFRP